MSLFMYKMEMKLLPTLFCDMFVKQSDVHSYRTRHAHNLRVASNHYYKNMYYIIIFLTVRAP